MILKRLQLVFLGVVFFLFFFHLNIVYSQTPQLPSDELSSSIFIIQQYGLPLPLDQTLCQSSYNIFTCTVDSTNSSVLHVTDISTLSVVYTNKGTPNPLSVLSFPKLQSIYILGDLVVANISLNMLTYLKNLPNLNSITLSDPAITFIPTAFPIGLPVLSTLRIWGDTLSSFSININSSMPTLTSIDLEFSITTAQTFTFTQTSFPLLTSIRFYSQSNLKVTTQVNLPLCEEILMSATSTSSSNYNLIIQDSSSVKVLYIGGTSSTLNPASLDNNNYPKLTSATFWHTSLTQYPFTTFPSTLTYLSFGYSQFSSVPTLQVPARVERISFNYNAIQSVPWDIFQNNYNMILDLTGNTGLTGTVPSTLCSSIRLLVKSTGITSIPNCMWCYSKDTSIISTSLTIPPGLTCPITTTTNFTLATVFGQGNIIGSGLGFGGDFTNYTLAPTTPNQVLAFKYVPSYRNLYTPSPTILNITLNNYYSGIYSFNFKIVESGLELLPNQQTYIQLVNSVQFTFRFRSINPYIPHTIQANSTTPCNIISNTTILTVTTVICKTPFIPNSNTYNFTISNQYSTLFVPLLFIQKYPTVTAALVYDDIQNGSSMISLYGYYGPYNQSSPSVTINNTIACAIQYIDDGLINCTITPTNQYGPVSVNVDVDGINYNRNDVIYFYPPSSGNGTTTTTTTGTNQPTPKEQCETNTHNCYGNGECQDNGQCKCVEDYSQLDNCLTKSIDSSNVLIEVNPTTPTSSFDIDGIDFKFEMYAVEEINYDGGSVVKQVLTNNWTSVSTKQDDLTTILYTLQYPADKTVNVTATISFSPQPRQITFGGKQINVDPNTIKVSSTINNWEFSNNINSLRVLFKTNISASQSVTVGCGQDQQSIDPFASDNYGSTIQYLRVIKDGIQFTGRFLDYIVSDGRPTYSRTQLVSLNPLANQDSSGDSDEAILGIILPQCQQCILDPDFTPLIIDNSQVNDGCDKQQSNAWKIAVGVSVGGVTLVSAIAGSVIYLKKYSKFKYSKPIVFMKKLTRSN